MLQQTFSKLFVVCEWIMNLVLLNLLFIFFSCTGLILFGFAPAYTAMSLVFKQLYEGEDVRIVRSFYTIFKSELIKSNKFGLIYGYLLILLFINFLFIQTLPVTIQTAAMLVLIVLTILVLGSSLYIFPLYTKFESTVWLLIKNSLLLAIAFLPRTIFTLILIFAVGVICFYQPILIFLIGFSGICAITMLTSQPCIKKIIYTT
ncbi:hypothetical protein DCE79_10555 [Lysinibacillus sp. 2017]|uniref:YesL family protein n=1 Tax=unclassified Lysinibacillus TaxID=2636778 RepID=UPI000D5273C0|nr:MULTISPECIES: DUF624 domain-containing protein [unclassified Lysinibacillus]AWE07797.1 hypothetical protein DCE79_10555 [Lysinibacillus sp. 2017]TGN34618.1 DUF624 domain-containing protein [Lysinibacillus sp. S2017]